MCLSLVVIMYYYSVFLTRYVMMMCCVAVVDVFVCVVHTIVAIVRHGSIDVICVDGVYDVYDVSSVLLCVLLQLFM